MPQPYKFVCDGYVGGMLLTCSGHAAVCTPGAAAPVLLWAGRAGTGASTWHLHSVVQLRHVPDSVYRVPPTPTLGVTRDYPARTTSLTCMARIASTARHTAKRRQLQRGQRICTVRQDILSTQGQAYVLCVCLVPRHLHM